jgi:hypothetical protein
VGVVDDAEHRGVRITRSHRDLEPPSMLHMEPLDYLIDRRRQGRRGKFTMRTDLARQDAETPEHDPHPAFKGLPHVRGGRPPDLGPVRRPGELGLRHGGKLDDPERSQGFVNVGPLPQNAADQWCESGVTAPFARHDSTCFLASTTRATKVAKVDVAGSNPVSRSSS